MSVGHVGRCCWELLTSSGAISGRYLSPCWAPLIESRRENTHPIIDPGLPLFSQLRIFPHTKHRSESTFVTVSSDKNSKCDNTLSIIRWRKLPLVVLQNLLEKNRVLGLVNISISCNEKELKISWYQSELSLYCKTCLPTKPSWSKALKTHILYQTFLYGTNKFVCNWTFWCRPDKAHSLLLYIAVVLGAAHISKGIMFSLFSWFSRISHGVWFIRLYGKLIT